MWRTKQVGLGAARVGRLVFSHSSSNVFQRRSMKVERTEEGIQPCGKANSRHDSCFKGYDAASLIFQAFSVKGLNFLFIYFMEVTFD